MDLLKKVLMLSVHRDDEVLSAGGTLAQCNELHIFYYNNIHPNVPITTYDEEANAVRDALKCTSSYSQFMNVNHLSDFPLTSHVTELEQLINRYKPTTIIGPVPSYNSDHRRVYEAMMTALRVHDRNWLVPIVLLAEQPESHTPAYWDFKPDVFIPIDISEKLQLYELYNSQQRAHRSRDHLIGMAIFRGMQCGHPCAEAFQSLRIITGGRFGF